MLGLCAALLFVGGLALDLWRAFSERRALAGVVDAAAVAGANGIDEDLWRRSQEARLDPARATALARANLAAQTDTRSLVDAAVSATPAEVTVSAVGTVEFTLLRVFMDDEPFTVTVSATADPRRSA